MAIVVVRIPREREMVARILPDEDVSDNPNRGIRALNRGESIALINGAEPDIIRGFVVPEGTPADAIHGLRERGYKVWRYDKWRAAVEGRRVKRAFGGAAISASDLAQWGKLAKAIGSRATLANCAGAAAAGFLRVLERLAKGAGPYAIGDAAIDAGPFEETTEEADAWVKANRAAIVERLGEAAVEPAGAVLAAIYDYALLEGGLMAAMAARVEVRAGQLAGRMRTSCIPDFLASLAKAHEAKRPGSRGGKGYYTRTGKWRYGTPPKGTRRRRKVVKKEPSPEPATGEEIILATGGLTRKQRQELMRARLAELGVTQADVAQRVVIMPRSRAYLGYWVDKRDKKHYIKMPTGRRRGRPKEPRPETADMRAEAGELAEAERAAAGPVVNVANWRETVRRIVSPEGNVTYILPEGFHTRRLAEKRQQLHESAMLQWIAKLTTPESPVAPAPKTNIGAIISDIRPAQAQRSAAMAVERWANVLWRREGSPLRVEVVQTSPERPDTRVLVGVYQDRLSRGEVVFPIYGEWDSHRDIPPALGVENNGHNYGGPAVRRIKSTGGWGILLYTIQHAPVFSDERADLSRRILSGREGLTMRQCVAMAMGMAGSRQHLAWDYARADAAGDDAAKALAMARMASLAGAMKAWIGISGPGRLKSAIKFYLGEEL